MKGHAKRYETVIITIKPTNKHAYGSVTPQSFVHFYRSPSLLDPGQFYGTNRWPT